MFINFFPDEHQREADEQQQAREPDGAHAESGKNISAEPRSEGEEEDNTEVADGFLQGLAALRDPIGTYRFHSAAHISDAHGTGESVSVNLAECLYLHRAGEGNHCVGHQVPAVRHKANEEEKKNLNNKNQLPPVDFADVLESLPDQLCSGNAESEGQ